MTTPVSWYGDPELKARMIATIKNNFYLGVYMQDETQSCCTCKPIKAVSISAYLELIGIPLWVVDLQTEIYKSLESDKRETEVLRLIDSIPVGVDLHQALSPLLARLLRETVLTAFTYDEWGCKKAIEQVLAALSGDPGSNAVEACKAADAAMRSVEESRRDLLRARSQDTNAASNAVSAAWRVFNIHNTTDTVAKVAKDIVAAWGNKDVWGDIIDIFEGEMSKLK